MTPECSLYPFPEEFKGKMGPVKGDYVAFVI